MISHLTLSLSCSCCLLHLSSLSKPAVCSARGFPQKFRDLKSQRTPNLYNCLMYSKMQHSALRCVTYGVSVGLEIPLYMPPISLSQVHVLYIFFLRVFSYSFGSAKCCSWGKCNVFQFINIFFHRWCSRFCI